MNVLLFFIFIYLYKSCKRLSAVKHSPPPYTVAYVLPQTRLSQNFRGMLLSRAFDRVVIMNGELQKV